MSPHNNLIYQARLQLADTRPHTAATSKAAILGCTYSLSSPPHPGQEYTKLWTLTECRCVCSLIPAQYPPPLHYALSLSTCHILNLNHWFRT